MTIDDIKLFKERVTLRALLVSVVMGVLGITFLYGSASKDWWKDYEVWRNVVQQVGGLLFITGTLTFLWELFGKRAFLDEILAKAQISKEIAFSGITKITFFFYRGINWTSYFSTVNKLDIFFTYGRTWRHIHTQELQKVASRDGARIRVVLPDPEDQPTVNELARRFKCTSEELKKLIREAESQFRTLCPSGDTKGAEVKIWFLPATPSFTFYRFDNIGILALYSHRGERVAVPTFICEAGGTLYNYIREEFEAMIRPGGLAKLIYDSSEEKK